MKELGAWNRVNGEAIFNTRPWIVATEGDGKIQPRINLKSTATAKDIRFTRNKNFDTLYAIAFDWPESGELVIETLGEDHMDLSSVKNVSLLGAGELDWKQDREGMKIQLGDTKPTDWAHSVKIEFEDKIPELIGIESQVVESPH